MNLSSKILRASFRGVSFLVEGETTTGGLKTVVHEFPNSNSRYVEHLGEYPATFQLTAVLHGVEFIQNRFDFEEALKKQDIGTLSHPIYGDVQVKVGKYTCVYDPSKMGKFVYSINFLRSVKDLSIVSLPPSISELDATSDTLLGKTLDLFENIYKNPSNNALTDLADSTLGLIDGVDQTIQNIVNPVEEAMAVTQERIEQIRRGVYNILKNGKDLRDSFEGLYTSIKNLSLDPKIMASVWSDIFKTTRGGVYTASTINDFNKNQSKVVIAEQLKVAALINNNLETAKSNYDNNEELNEYSIKNISYFNEVLNTSDFNIDESNINSYSKGREDFRFLTDVDEIRNQLYSIKATNQLILNEKLQNIWKIERRIIHNMSSLALMEYYHFLFL